jgi:hypothetical protein
LSTTGAAARAGWHAAGRRARAGGTGPGGTWTRGRRTRNWPVHRLCRRERVVADARRASRRLRDRARAGHRSGPRRGQRRCRLRLFRSRGRRRGRLRLPQWGRFGAGGFPRRRGGLDPLAFGRGRAVAGGLLLRGLAAAERLTQPTRDRRFYRRRCGFDEFALFAEPGEYFLAGNTEFLS